MKFLFLRTLLGLGLVSAHATAAEKAWIYFGTVTSGESQGIYRSQIDLETGETSEVSLAAEVNSPGFLAIHPTQPRLYSTSRPAGSSGEIIAFNINPQSGELTRINSQSSAGNGPTHVAVSRDGSAVFVAHYSGGSISALPLDSNGALLPATSTATHSGSSINAARQEAPHPHWIGTDPSNKFVLVPDLGTDEVVVYDFDSKKITLQRVGAGKAPLGGGPRHFAFSPEGNRGYVLNELTLSVTGFDFDPNTGSLKAFQTIPTLSEKDKEIPNKASEIRIHPTGKFLYAANRGHDSITVFAIDDCNGQLTWVENESIRGAWPRHFNLDPTGQWALVACRDTSTVSVFKINPATGGLIYQSRLLKVPNPICVQFYSPESK